MDACRHQAGDVGDVGDDDGTDIVPDAGEALKIDDPGVCCGAAEQQSGPVARRESLDLIKVMLTTLHVNAVLNRIVV